MNAEATDPGIDPSPPKITIIKQISVISGAVWTLTSIVKSNEIELIPIKILAIIKAIKNIFWVLMPKRREIFWFKETALMVFPMSVLFRNKNKRNVAIEDKEAAISLFSGIAILQIEKVEKFCANCKLYVSALNVRRLIFKIMIERAAIAINWVVSFSLKRYLKTKI